MASFLSQPILTGFLNGIALVIIAGQLEALFGYSGDAVEFFPKLLEFANGVDQAHLPTLILGLGLLALLVVIRFLSPRLPSALMVVILGIVLVSVLDLESRGVTVLGNVPAGLPSLHLAMPTMTEFISIMTDGAAIALLSFISGVLTAKSFARRNRYDVDANQALIGLGASNIISGLAQGFPVTGADSRTAVNSSMGGKSQVVGLVAAAAMLLVLFFLTGPLAFVPKAALSAVIIVSAIGLFDQKALVELYATNRLELGISLVSMLGVLILGVLPGVGLAIGLSLAWPLYVVSIPPDAVLGRVPGLTITNSITERIGSIGGFVCEDGTITGNPEDPCGVETILYPISGPVYATMVNPSAGETRGAVQERGTVVATPAFKVSFFGLMDTVAVRWSPL